MALRNYLKTDVQIQRDRLLGKPRLRVPIRTKNPMNDFMAFLVRMPQTTSTDGAWTDDSPTRS